MMAALTDTVCLNSAPHISAIPFTYLSTHLTRQPYHISAANPTSPSTKQQLPTPLPASIPIPSSSTSSRNEAAQIQQPHSNEVSPKHFPTATPSLPIPKQPATPTSPFLPTLPNTTHLPITTTTTIDFTRFFNFTLINFYSINLLPQLQPTPPQTLPLPRSSPQHRSSTPSSLRLNINHMMTLTYLSRGAAARQCQLQFGAKQIRPTRTEVQIIPYQC